MKNKIIIYTDGGARGNPGPAGAGVVFGVEENGEFKPIKKYKKFLLGHKTNNQAEYMALIYALKLALKAGYDEVECRTDSELMANQMEGKFKVKNINIKGLFIEAHNLSKKFKKFSIRAVKRSENKLADALVNAAMDLFS